MDINAVAEKIRKAVMDRAEQDGRVFHASAIEDEVRKVLALEILPTAATDADKIIADAAKLRVMSDARYIWNEAVARQAAKTPFNLGPTSSFGDAPYKPDERVWDAACGYASRSLGITIPVAHNAVYSHTKVDGTIEYVDRAGEVVATPPSGTIIVV